MAWASSPWRRSQKRVGGPLPSRACTPRAVFQQQPPSLPRRGPQGPAQRSRVWEGPPCARGRQGTGHRARFTPGPWSLGRWCPNLLLCAQRDPVPGMTRRARVPQPQAAQFTPPWASTGTGTAACPTSSLSPAAGRSRKQGPCLPVPPCPSLGRWRPAQLRTRPSAAGAATAQR